MTKVILEVGISGTHNGENWPEKGSVIDLPESLAADMVTTGQASLAGKKAEAAEPEKAVAATPETAEAPKAETAEAPKPEKRAPAKKAPAKKAPAKKPKA